MFYISDDDYTAISSVFVLLSGEIVQREIVIQLKNDDKTETDEFFEINLDIILADLTVSKESDTAIVTILDDDCKLWIIIVTTSILVLLVIMIQFQPMVYTVREDSGSVTVSIISSAQVITDTIIRIFDVAGTATSMLHILYAGLLCSWKILRATKFKF